MLTRHRGKWAIRIKLGGEWKRISTGFDATAENRQNAERKAREIESSLTRQAYGNTVLEIIKAYKDDLPKRERGVVSTVRVACAEKALATFFTSHREGDVTPEECRAYSKARRALGRSNGTIRRELGVLRAALQWANKSTPARFDMPPAGEPRDRFLTRDEFGKILEASRPMHHLTVFLHLAIATGARREAILGLRWDTHIDFENRRVWLGFKQSGKNRTTVPMTQTLFTVLKDAKEKAIGDFVVEWAGRQIKDIDTALNRGYEKAGLAAVPAKAHVIRHTAGAWMAIDGVKMHEISKRLGHSSIAVTERYYAHLHPDYMEASTKALEV